MKRILSILSFLFFIAINASAQDGSDKSIRTYPNPASSYINFDFEKNYQKGLTILIYNFTGRKVFETKNIEPKTNVNLTDFIRGVYIYQILDLTGKIVETGKFQVSK